MTTITNDISRNVAHQVPQLRESCGFCIALTRDVIAHISDGFVGFGDCVVCMGQGWMPTTNLNTIITSIDHPFTLVLSNDMMGWMADVALDGAPLDGGETPMFENPLDAVYAALYRSLTERKPQRRTRGRGRFISTEA
jgi:hypothetical protein